MPLFLNSGIFYLWYTMVKLSSKDYVKNSLSLKEFHEKKNKILIWHDKGGLGDVFMQRMMFDDVRRLLPDAEITFACLPEYLDAVTDHPAIDKFVDVRKVDTNDYIYWFNTCVGIADRYENFRAPNYNKHRSDIWAEYCGLELTTHEMNFVIDKDLKEKANKHLDTFRKKGKPIIGFAPKSKIATKTLLPHQIQVIADRCKDYSLVSFHREEINDCKKIGIPTIGNISIKELIAYVDCVDYMIAVDTAAFHLAGGLKKPLCGIFTFADGKIYGKHYDFILVQKHKDNGNWDCGPCFVFGKCPKSKKLVKPCLTELNAQELIDGIDKMFQKWEYKSF